MANNTLNSWLPISADSDFSIYNLPFGIFSNLKSSHRVGIAIGDKIIDLMALASSGAFRDLIADDAVLQQPYLNEFIALGKKTTSEVRNRIQQWLVEEASPLQKNPQYFINQSECILHLPVQVGDYTDFYSSIEHATNVGKMFRDPDNALLPNWRHLPVAYHGRASSIVVSGTNVRRPSGQTNPGSSSPVFGPTKRLDFELEMGFIIGQKTTLGKPVEIDQAEEHIFGMVLFNDWSARDIQKWEYVPLGPFLSKNFASSISPWVVTMEALEPFKTQGPKQEPEVLPYLQHSGQKNYDINLEVILKTTNGDENMISQTNFKYMYWNMAQQLAHHTVNGCNINVGDVMASGTISGSTPASYGSMLELSWAGSNPLEMKDGSKRTFVEDEDTVIMRGHAKKNNMRVGFGEVKGKILPAV